MKKIIIVLLAAGVLFKADLVFADVGQPRLPVGLNEFFPVQSSAAPCGTLFFDGFQVSDNVFWIAAYVDRHQFPNPFLVSRFSLVAKEFWFDFDRDGKFDEKHSDEAVVMEVLMKICELIKK